MNVQTNNYNPLGRLGSHYERPEYRPPQDPSVGSNLSPEHQTPGDRSTLSTRNTAVAAKAAPPVSVSGKMSLELAKSMTMATSESIRKLSPLSTTQEPHNYLPTSLMSPIYV